MEEIEHMTHEKWAAEYQKMIRRSDRLQRAIDFMLLGLLAETLVAMALAIILLISKFT